MQKKSFLFLGIALLMWGCTEKVPPPPPITGTIQLWTTTQPDFFEALGREFASEITASDLQFQIVIFDTESALEKTLTNALAEGTGPDIVVSEGDWIFHHQKKFLPLSGDETFSSKKFAELFVPASAELLTDEQGIWGIPLGVDTLALIFNEAHFSEHLSDTPIPAKQWKELLPQIKSLTKPDNSLQRFERSGIALGRIDNVTRGSEVLEHLLVQMVKNLFSPDGTEAFFATSTGVTSEGQRVNFGQEALRFFLNFSRDGSENFSWNELLADKNSEEKDFQTFAEGKVSLIFANAQDFWKLYYNMLGHPDTISQNNARVALFPQFDSSQSDAVFLANVLALAVPRSADDPTLAWQFLKFAAQPQNLQIFARDSHWPSARIDILKEQESDPILGIFAEQAQRARVARFPLLEKEFLAELSAFVQEIFRNEVAPNDGFTRLEEKLSQKLEKQKILEKQLQ